MIANLRQPLTSAGGPRRAHRSPNAASPAVDAPAAKVARDTGAFMAGDVVDRVLGLAFLVVATKLYGVESYGVYLVALAVFQLVRTVVSFGLGRALVRDVAASDAVGDVSRVKGSILLAFAVSLSLAAVAFAVLSFGADALVVGLFPSHPQAAAALRVFGLLTPLFAINFVVLQSLYGLGRVRQMVVANNLVEPAVRLGSLVALWTAGVGGHLAMPFSYLTALAASTLWAARPFRRHVLAPLAGVQPVLRVRETLAFAAPVTLNDLATRGFRGFTTYLFAIFRSSAEVGLFGVTLKVTGVVFLFSSSLAASLRPRIARLLAEGKRDELGAEMRAFTRWIATFAALPFGLLVCFPEQILRALDPEFVAAATAVRVLSCGLLVSQAAGPLGALLVMSGRPKQALYFVVAVASAFTLLTLYAIPTYGLVGAAASATAVVVVFVPCISVYVRRTVGVGIYGRALWKPAAAAAVALAVASVVAAVVPAWRALDAAAIACSAAAVYVALLAAFGVEKEERAVLADMFGGFGKLKRKLGLR